MNGITVYLTEEERCEAIDALENYVSTNDMNKYIGRALYKLYQGHRDQQKYEKYTRGD